jgi:hypothetical protein
MNNLMKQSFGAVLEKMELAMILEQVFSLDAPLETLEILHLCQFYNFQIL